MEKTHYDLLGVPQTASTEQIRRAYRQKMKAAHPDQFAATLAQAQMSGNDVQIAAARRHIAHAEARAKQINTAYDILSDPGKRRRYDRDLQLRVRSSSVASRPTTTRTARSRPTERARPRPSPRPSPPPRQSADIWPEMTPRRMFEIMIGIVVLGAVMYVSYEPSKSSGDATESPAAAFVAGPEQDAESRFERGLDYLAQSRAVNDAHEQSALVAFIAVMATDPDFTLAYRMVGEIYYDRWRAEGSSSHRVLAQQYLGHYELLIDGPVDSEVREMLAALAS
jgi:curved DNA-binding protein CbpA